MARSYPEPRPPRSFTSWIEKNATRQRGAAGRTVDCWDVKGRADGVQWQKRFARAGLAQTWQDRLQADFAGGLAFDLRTRQFVRPEAPDHPSAPSVLALTEAFYREHPEWEPKTKVAAASSFNRARRWLLVPGAELRGKAEGEVEDYLRTASFLPAHLAHRMTPAQAAGRTWLEEHSMRADQVGVADVMAFVRRSEVNQRDPEKRVSAATITRLLQPLKACWAWAATEEDIPVERNPWTAVQTRKKVKGRTSIGSGRAGLAVDAGLVLDVAGSRRLAAACVEFGTWGGVVECFVLVMAMAGLRPGEAAGLLWEDVELPDGEGTGWLTVRRSHRPTSVRWLDVDEDPEWGPLKDRDLAETRRAPVHPLLVDKLRSHRDAYGEGPDGLVFHRDGRPFDHDLFGRNVWAPARSALFPSRADLDEDDPRQPKLSRLRRHDLRHAACSWWLREGVDAVVCQRWSGHKTLSVFLDIYQGVAPGREEEGIGRLVRSAI